MEQKELETLIEELETRVDRLRSLYEQYFMGIERIIPAVPHKDVERRFYILRRQSIRNTGLRFRFQNVLLKYNTYQTYWMRITRQIEEGTYKRDVRRANARFANPPPKADRAAENSATNGHNSADEIDDLEIDVDVDMGESGAFEDEALTVAKEQVAQIRATLRSSTLPKPPPLPSAPRPTREPPKQDEPPTQRRLPTAPPVGGRPQVAKKRASDQPPRTPPPRIGVGVELDNPFDAETKPRRSDAPKKSPSLHPPAAIVSKTRSSRPAAPRAPSPPPLPARPGVPPPRPRPTQGPAGAAQGVAPAKTQAPPPPALSDERVRQLYSQYVEAKRKAGESTAALTFEGLSRSLKDSTARLKEKHSGKSVDFEVTVKDGKAILRPIVK